MDSLAISERQELQQHERVIQQGLNTFVEVGQALAAIRDSRLYREDYGTFEDYCQSRWGFTDRRARMFIDSASVLANLQTGTIVPILPATESQARPLTKLEPAEQVRVWEQVVATAPEGKITAAHVQAVVDEVKDNKPHVSFNSGNNEWYTPSEYIEAARQVMGEIDLDPASSDIANKTVRADVYLTAEDDGLRYSWNGRVWMNPPYAGELIGKFTSKLAEHYDSGEITEAIVLVNNSTETVWFHDLVGYASAVVFPRGRVKFIDSNGNPGAPLQGQAVIYFGHQPDLFLENFKSYGWGAKL